jgi:hypothetical protein
LCPEHGNPLVRRWILAMGAVLSWSLLRLVSWSGLTCRLNASDGRRRCRQCRNDRERAAAPA